MPVRRLAPAQVQPLTATSSPATLQQSYARIRAQAEKLAGKPGDISPWVKLLHQIFKDSKGNHTFPMVALHGALWAQRYYARTGPIAELTGLRYFYSRTERESRMEMLRNFSEGFKAVNREVFIDTYTNYYFSKQFGRHQGAEKFVRPELLKGLNQIHRAAANGVELSAKQKRELFELSLRYEQETTVSAAVSKLVKEFTCPILRALTLKPLVHFEYFPKLKHLAFNDFSNKEERIRHAMRAYDLAARAGWSKVEAAMAKY